MAADDEIREALYCIKCGACLNICRCISPSAATPMARVYGRDRLGRDCLSPQSRRNRGHSPALHRLRLLQERVSARIDVPEMVVELKKRLLAAHGMPLAGRAAMNALGHPMLFERAIRFARNYQGPFVDEDGTLKDLPFASGIVGEREFPGLARQFLRTSSPSDRCGGRQTARVSGFERSGNPEP